MDMVQGMEQSSADLIFILRLSCYAEQSTHPHVAQHQ